MANLPESTDVLICGAGPAGLSAALSVAHHAPGISVTIVDALPARHNESRALVIHAQTMEALKDIGASEAIEKGGHPAPVLRVQSGDKHLIQAEPWRLHRWTSFPYILLIAQWRTEEILSTLLKERNIEIIRPLRVSNLASLEETSDAGFKFLVTFEDGRSIKAKYVVGADGSRSTIRTSCDIPWTQWSSETTFMRWIHRAPEGIGLADIRLDPDTPRECLGSDPRGILSPGAFLLFIPTEVPEEVGGAAAVATKDGETPLIYRMIFPISPEELEKKRELFTLSYLQDRLNKSYHPPPPEDKSSPAVKRIIPHIKDVLWTSSFRIRFCLADQFVKRYPNGGHVILVGDAAHIHSPAGGQGMNMGMCDGLETGLAIASHIQARDDTVLKKLNDRRREIATVVINMSRNLGWFASINKGWTRYLRDWVIWSVGQFPFLKTQMAWTVSGLKFMPKT